MAKKKDPKLEDFDLEAEYDAEISPLMVEIIAICKRLKIPMFATFNYAYDKEGNGPGYCTTMMNAAPVGFNDAVTGLRPILDRSEVDGHIRPAPFTITTVSGDGKTTIERVIP